jgi:hypothetical protein
VHACQAPYHWATSPALALAFLITETTENEARQRYDVIEKNPNLELLINLFVVT